MADNLYVFSRDTPASVRLYFQHWMWRYQTGYLLHPNVVTTKEGLKIADIACGTGIWLIEVARSLSTSTQLDGFDISEDQFPDKGWLPKNVTLSSLDSLAPLPEHLIGKYDVVHIGLLVMIIKNENPVPLLKNVMAMLKPGGYVQWDEMDVGSLNPSFPDKSRPCPHYDALHTQSTAFFDARNLTYRWVSELDKFFKQQGLDVLSYTRLPIHDDLAKPWTEMQLMATWDVNEKVLVPAALKDPSASPSAKEWRQMYGKVVEEVNQGMSIRMDMIVVVGKKGS
ncbi:MAG: hypothetical protein ASARMPREDX12_000999 [Alectoria sarmentosa]|nr:MAG: hypothetical protein ASARMPREDX12_000999 [Alectoria sarmentosa]